MAQSQQGMANQLFGGQPAQSMGALEAVKEAFLAVAPGLKNFGQDVRAELVHQGGAGAHELAAALFSGTSNAFVMYQRRGHDEPSHEQSQEGQEMQQDGHSQQQERGGLSM